jgi:UrcA family protein
MKRTPMLSGVLCVAGVAALAAAAPSLAQPAGEEIIVTGRDGEVPDNVRTLTQAVSYADLDLSTEAGRRELRHRVNLTARFLCDKLGESRTSSVSVVPSCREAAVEDAMKRVGTAEESAAPRGTAWVAGPAWQPPYPQDWTEKYPFE